MTQRAQTASCCSLSLSPAACDDPNSTLLQPKTLLPEGRKPFPSQPPAPVQGAAPLLLGRCPRWAEECIRWLLSILMTGFQGYGGLLPELLHSRTPQCCLL